MNLHVAYPAALLEHVASVTCQGCDGLVLEHGHPDQVLASIVEGNPLATGWIAAADLPGSALITWSGTLADDLFASDPATWSSRGRAALETFCQEAGKALVAGGRRLLFRPHARHVLSDTPSTLAFLNDHPDGPFGVVLAPADLLEAPMLDRISEHLERILTLIGPRADAVLLEDISPIDGGVATCPLGQGLLPREEVLALLGQLDATIPLIISGRSVDEQIRWLDRDAAARGV